VYLGDVTSKTIGEKIESTKKEIFFNLFPNIKAMRTIPTTKVIEMTLGNHTKYCQS
jgi:hypothetical protein